MKGSAPGGRQPPDQANRLGLRVRRKLAATIHIHHRHCYYYSARKLILILPPQSIAVKVRSPCPRLYIAAVVTTNTNCPRRDSNLGPLTVTAVKRANHSTSPMRPDY